MTWLQYPEASIGLPVSISSNTFTLTLSTATTKLAQALPTKNKTLSKVKVLFISKIGTLTTGGLKMEVKQDASNMVPGTVVDSSVTVTGGPPSAAGWVEFTGFTYACAGQRLWFELSSLEAAPASNFTTWRTPSITGANCFYNQSNIGTWGPAVARTTNGTGYTNILSSTPVLRLEYLDGTFDGFALEQTIADTTSLIFGTHEAGMQFTVPSNLIVPVSSLGANINRTGLPSAGAVFKLYKNGSLINTGAPIPAGAFNTSGAFYSQQLLDGSNNPITYTFNPGDILKWTVAEDTNSDSSSTAYRFPRYIIENDPNSLALIPFGLQEAYFNGTVWSTDPTILHPMVLGLDMAGLFRTPSRGQAFAG